MSDYFYANDKEFGRESQSVPMYGSESDASGFHDHHRATVTVGTHEVEPLFFWFPLVDFNVLTLLQAITCKTLSISSILKTFLHTNP